MTDCEFPVKSLIRFYKAAQNQYQFLIDETSNVMLEETIKALERLEQLEETKNG
jgi:hypothetical protein